MRPRLTYDLKAASWLRYLALAALLIGLFAGGSPAAETCAPADLTGAWEAKTANASVEAFVAQKGPFLLAVAYVSGPNGKINVYHMGGMVEGGKIKVSHSDGYVFEGVIAGPDQVDGALMIKSYLPKIEAKACRRLEGRLSDERAEQFFKETLPFFPDPAS